jgi:hypothetical protein
MLDLGRIPRRASDRRDGAPLVIAGGPLAALSEPLAPFLDLVIVGDEEESKKIVELMASAQKVMNEAEVPPDFGALESPIESVETAAKDEVQAMKPVQVRLIDYPPGFKSQLVQGKAFQVNGEVFEIYNVMEPKKGRPRFMIRGIGILGILEDPQVKEIQKGAENGKE